MLSSSLVRRSSPSLFATVISLAGFALSSSALAQADTTGVSMDARALAYAQSFAIDQAQALTRYARSSKGSLDPVRVETYAQLLTSSMQDAKTAAHNLDSDIREKDRLKALLDDLDTALSEVRDLQARAVKRDVPAAEIAPMAERIQMSLVEADKEYQRIAAWPNTEGMRLTEPPQLGGTSNAVPAAPTTPTAPAAPAAPRPAQPAVPTK